MLGAGVMAAASRVLAHDEKEHQNEKRDHLMGLLQGSGSGYQTLIALVRAAGLEQRLTGAETLTLFAPGDGGWSRMGDPLRLSREQQRALLLRHLCAGAVLRQDLMTPGGRSSLAGPHVALDAAGMVNGVPFVVHDIAAANGVLHVIREALPG